MVIGSFVFRKFIIALIMVSIIATARRLDFRYYALLVCEAFIGSLLGYREIFIALLVMNALTGSKVIDMAMCWLPESCALWCVASVWLRLGGRGRRVFAVMSLGAFLAWNAVPVALPPAYDIVGEHAYAETPVETAKKVKAKKKSDPNEVEINWSGYEKKANAYGTVSLSIKDDTTFKAQCDVKNHTFYSLMDAGDGNTYEVYYTADEFYTRTNGGAWEKQEDSGVILSIDSSSTWGVVKQLAGEYLKGESGVLQKDKTIFSDGRLITEKDGLLRKVELITYDGGNIQRSAVLKLAYSNNPVEKPE